MTLFHHWLAFAGLILLAAAYVAWRIAENSNALTEGEE